jgi:phosphoribosylformylglycinamidine cyclo-ligase
MTERQDSYTQAGVNADVAAGIKQMLGRYARNTYQPGVLSGVGFFGGLFQMQGYRQPVLVSSVDGVGTKLKIAVALNKHDTVGIDIVNHSVNDIFTSGADPLFFLDYIAMGKLVPETVEGIAIGLTKACLEVNCALIGGETAEMPGVYTGNDYDLVGCIVGAVEKDRIIMGKDIKAGDVVIGIPSSGLHTNGYSLVRKIFGVAPDVLNTYYSGLGRTLGESLLEPHHCYYKELKPQLHLIKGLAHITGGGFIGNIPRILPPELMVDIDSNTWAVPPIFQLIQEKGNVGRDEMFHVFNMGIGMTVICAFQESTKIVESVPGAKVIGQVAPQFGDARVMLDGVGYHRDKVR